MWIKWKRYTFGALLLASLSLLLFGCSDFSGAPATQTSPVTKQLAGIVSDPGTGLPLANATVTAYAIDAAGVQGTAPLSVNPASTTSDANGNYSLKIPADYAGSVMIEAVVPSNVLQKIAKALFASTAGSKIKAAVPKSFVVQADIPPVMVSFATNAVVTFLEQNITSAGTAAGFTPATVFSPENIQRANVVMETFFGANFPQVPPPKSGDIKNSTKAQQDLLVSIQAINLVVSDSNRTVAQIVVSIANAGLADGADAIKGAITRVVTVTLVNALPAEYLPSAAINAAISNATSAPVAPPALTSTTPPGATASLTASAVNAKTVGLAWSAASDGGAGVAGYCIYRAGLSTPFVAIDTVAGKESTSYRDVTAEAATQYSYKVVAFDAARNFSQSSNLATATTPALVNAADTAPPTMPAGLACSGVSESQVNLHWLQSTDVNASGAVVPAAGYNVYRDSQVIAVVTEASYIDNTVKAGSDYSYYVKAFDASSNLSAKSSLLTLRTAAPAGATPPAAPTGLALQAADYGKVSLTWSGYPGVTYNVYRGADQIAKGIGAPAYTDSAVVPNSPYLYTVRAANANGESAPSNQLAVAVPANPSATYTPPTTPTNLVLAAPATAYSASLYWSASTKPDGDGIVYGYDVLRATGAGSDFTVIARVRQPGYTDTSLAASTSYSYQVRAFSSNGARSAASTPQLTVTTSALVDVTDLTPPSAPGNLVASATANAVALSWTAATKSSGDGIVAGYRVYRSGLQIADVAVDSGNAASPSYFDNTAKANTTYSYLVKAYDHPGNLSAASNEVTVITPDQVPNTNTITGKVTVNGIGLAGVTVTVTGTGVGSLSTDANGNFSVPVLYGSYTVTPSLQGYLFTPASKAVTVNSASVPSQEFSAVRTGTITGGVTGPSGSGGVVMTYPSGTVIGGVTYPPGTIVGGVSYPSGAVIGGITYPTATVIGGATYPPGTVLGGVTYPSGVVIGGVSYPAGTVVGGVAFPVGAVTAGINFPSGTVIGGVTYTSGAVVGGVNYPAGTIIGGVTYPNGALIGAVGFPSGAVIGGVTYPSGIVAASLGFPSGFLVTGVNYPTSSITGNLLFPALP